MRIEVNGTPRDIAAATVADALSELGWGEARVATLDEADALGLAVAARLRAAGAVAAC